ARLDELHLAALEGEEGEVAAHADVAAGVDGRANLTDEDVSREDELAGVALDSAALAVRIAAVAGAALTFLVCHCVPLTRLRRADGRDLERRERLAVALLAAVALAALVLEDDDLL